MTQLQSLVERPVAHAAPDAPWVCALFMRVGMEAAASRHDSCSLS